VKSSKLVDRVAIDYIDSVAVEDSKETSSLIFECTHNALTAHRSLVCHIGIPINAT